MPNLGPRIGLVALAAALLLPVSLASGGLDFSLQHKVLSADGLDLDQPFITDGASKIFIRWPRDWKIADSSAGIICYPGGADTEVRLASYGGDKLLTIDAGGAHDLLVQVSGQISSEAKNVTTVAAEVDPLPLFGWTTLEATLRYEVLGQVLRRSVLYANMLPGRVVTLTVIAPDADFDRVHKQARQVLSSWFEPSRDLPPDLQQKYAAPSMGGG